MTQILFTKPLRNVFGIAKHRSDADHTCLLLDHLRDFTVLDLTLSSAILSISQNVQIAQNA